MFVGFGMNLLIKFSIVAVLSVFAMSAGNVGAATITYTLDSVIAGNINGKPPTAVLTDVLNYNNTGFNAVQLTMNNTLADKQFITQWVFNINPALNSNLSALQLTPLNGGVATINKISNGVNTVDLPPVKEFDLGFDFQTSAGPGRFDAGESLLYALSLQGKSIFASDFAFTNGGGPGPRPPYFSAAMIQGGKHGINSKVGAPGKTVGVPEPASYLLLGSFLTVLFLYKRQRRTAQ